jgi:hypothetical protein
MSLADADMRDHLAAHHCIGPPAGFESSVEVAARALCRADSGLPPCPCMCGRPCIAADYQIPARAAVLALSEAGRLTSGNIERLEARRA